jgi:hypothetical protein
MTRSPIIHRLSLFGWGQGGGVQVAREHEQLDGFSQFFIARLTGLHRLVQGFALHGALLSPGNMRGSASSAKLKGKASFA